MNRTLLAAVAAAALAAVPALAADPIAIGIPVGLSGANSVVAPIRGAGGGTGGR